MTYPRRLINPGESVVLDLKPHWWFFARHIAIGAGLVVVLILFFRLDGELQTVTLYAWLAAVVGFAVWLVLAYLNWQFTFFVLTDRRVIYRTGVFAKRGVEIPLPRINNINFHQGMVDRLVGAGSLEIQSAGQDGESRFSHVRHPDGIQQEIYRQIEVHARDRANYGREPIEAIPAQEPAANIPEQLRQLAELRDSGVISDADFEAKKAQLLERM
jgi:uncharacterized membrane protein YdbT with pleckstrin-like domain